ncbi:MAG TPA: hypothetical protein VFQ45_08925 [Longimicrobium sp.]|nr:hypothetical protein [Longimicrobium sp.]
MRLFFSTLAALVFALVVTLASPYVAPEATGRLICAKGTQLNRGTQQYQHPYLGPVTVRGTTCVDAWGRRYAGATRRGFAVLFLLVAGLTWMTILSLWSTPAAPAAESAGP